MAHILHYGLSFKKTAISTTDEMYRVFNMGIGMIAIVDKESVAEIQKLIPEKTFIIGELVEGNRKVELIS